MINGDGPKDIYAFMCNLLNIEHNLPSTSNEKFLVVVEFLRGNPVLEAMFWRNRTVTDAGCWEWNRQLGPQGYGLFNMLGCRFGTHRIAFFLANKNHGVNPRKPYVCHSCDNRKCINPKHLWLGSARDNVHDARDKGRLRRYRMATPMPKITKRIRPKKLRRAAGVLVCV